MPDGLPPAARGGRTSGSSAVRLESVRLQVARARPYDLGAGRARLPADVLDRLGVREGEPVEIRGKRRTAAIALRLSFEDRGLGLARLDGIQRTNAGISIGEHVEVRAVRSALARRLKLAPARDAEGRLEGSEALLARALAGRAVCAGDLVTVSPGAVGRATPPGTVGALGIQELRLSVVATEPAGVVCVDAATAVEIELEPARRRPDAGAHQSTYDDVGGLDDVIAQLREVVHLPLRHPELFERLGIDPPRGVLLHGPPGTGKTLLARALAGEEDVRFFVGGAELMGPHHGESERRLRELFAEAATAAPSIVFLDDLDAIAPRREDTAGETERRVVSQLLTLLDGLEPRGRVVVIGATNRLEAIDEALRRPGRFDREVAVGVPDAEGRYQILAVHTRGMPIDPVVDLRELARHQHGFAGADLAALAREAAMAAVRRHVAGRDLEAARRAAAAADSSGATSGGSAGGSAGAPPDDTMDGAPGGPADALALDGLRIGPEDFAAARRRVRPSAMREIAVQVPDARWERIGGLGEVKRLLREGIELPLKRPEAFQTLGIRPAKGFLLFGPPGTGKTLIARAVAGETAANFIPVRASDLLSKWYGESERQVARLFARARQLAPAVLFLDEIDALAPPRGSGHDRGATDRVVNTLLAELDGVEPLERVVVIGATNRPTLLDPALLRPGRLDELVYVPPPDAAARLAILGLATAAVPLGPDADLAWVAERSAGLTGADLEGLVRRAALAAWAAAPESPRVTMAHLQAALAATPASVTPEMEREYEALLRELRREGPRGRGIGFV